MRDIYAEERGEVLIGNPVIEAMDFRVDSVTGELPLQHPESPVPVEEILARVYNPKAGRKGSWFRSVINKDG